MTPARRIRIRDFMQYRSVLRALPVTLQERWKTNDSFQTRRHDYHCRDAMCRNASAALSTMMIVARMSSAWVRIAMSPLATMKKPERSVVYRTTVGTTALKTTTRSAATKKATGETRGLSLCRIRSLRQQSQPGKQLAAAQILPAPRSTPQSPHQAVRFAPTILSGLPAAGPDPR